MFRKMRRFKQELPREEALGILQKNNMAVLGVNGDDGYPYTVPINYAYVNGKIYIHGAKQGHKLDAMKNDGRVSLCIVEKDDIVAEELTTYFKSVIVFGKARIIDGEAEIIRTAESFGKKFLNDGKKVSDEVQKELKALCMIEITPEHITGKEAIELTRKR